MACAKPAANATDDDVMLVGCARAPSACATATVEAKARSLSSSGREEAPVSVHPVLCAALRRDLLPVLSSYLHNDSMMDIVQRYDLYVTLMKFVGTMAREGNLLPLLSETMKDSDGDELSSLLDSLTQLHLQANVLIKSGVKDIVSDKAGDDDDAAKSLRLSHEVVATYEKILLSISDTKDARLRQSAILREREVINLTDDDDDTSTSAKGSGSATGSCHGNGDGAAKGASSSSSVATALNGRSAVAEEAVNPKLEQEYTNAMTALRFALDAVCDRSHTFYHGTAVTSTAAPPRRMMRIGQEIASLSTSLPISYNSCIFVRADTDRMDYMKALVIGPEGTPYANGMFEFDIHLSADYPKTPPRCQFVTTGRGAVRFNPNLYASGKVCLSLLGTWQGPSWDSKNSTLLQVLISIQAMILVPDPYFNEPGYESTRNQPAGQYASHAYNERIREATVRYAMTQQLLSPSPVFKKVIREHFSLKGDAIVKQLEQWMTEHGTQQSKQSKNNFFDGGVLGSTPFTLMEAVEGFKRQLAFLEPIEL